MVPQPQISRICMQIHTLLRSAASKNEGSIKWGNPFIMEPRISSKQWVRGMMTLFGNSGLCYLGDHLPATLSPL